MPLSNIVVHSMRLNTIDGKKLPEQKPKRKRTSVDFFRRRRTVKMTMMILLVIVRGILLL